MPKVIEKPVGSKTTVFDMNDPKDVELANKFADKMKRAIKGEKEPKSEEELEKKLDNAEIGKEVFEDMMSKLRDAYTLEGLAVPKIESKEDLENAVKNLTEIQNRGKREVPSGNAPLNRGQETGGSSEGSFDSMEELIDSVREDARSGDKNAQKILDNLFLKALKGVKENEKGISTYKPNEEDLSEIQRLNKHWRERQLKRRSTNEMREEY